MMRNEEGDGMESNYLIMLDKHRENHKWFDENYSMLVESYNNEHVAIYEQKVVDHDADLDALIARIKKSYPIEQVFIQYVTKEKITLILMVEKCG